MIHNILLLKRSGEKLYNRSYSEIAWNEILTSGFISALFNFTHELFSADIQDLELGPYKLLFETEGSLILVAIFDKFDSIISVRKNLIEIKKRINSDYKNLLRYDDLQSQEEYEKLRDVIDQVVSETTNETISKGLIEEYGKILDEFRSNSEILDCDLISGSGIPLMKEWNKDFLELCLRQIDAFWKSKKYLLDQIIISYDPSR
ncbi:MAG: hypothetical protein P8Y70_21130 [Candidatus Lokiarchaeota archaeon]